MRQLFCTKNITIILSLALFNFVFLSAEYLFDGMMAYVTDSQGVMHAQNFILGASVIGFLGFPAFCRLCKKVDKYLVSFLCAIICAICLFFIYGHDSYGLTLTAGLICFALFGIAGGAVCFYGAQTIVNRRQTAKVVGIAYALSVFLQYLNNNLVKNQLFQTTVIMTFMAILLILLHLMNNNYESLQKGEYEITDSTTSQAANPKVAAVSLLLAVVFMTCIFSTLNNAVTLVHASGDFDIGQWPRLLLAVSGLAAGFLYDLWGRKYMSIMMYVVTLLATICIVVIEMGGTFVSGLILFYISAGFFVVFFMTGFMDLSYQMRQPRIWAGIGRATNNLCAVLTSAISVALLSSGNRMAILIVALLFFAVINAALFLYYAQLHEHTEKKEQLPQDAVSPMSEEERMEAFAQAFKLTVREREVLQELLRSEDNVQEIAEELAISRAALYRHITSLNEKTNTKSRVGIMQFYYNWKK